MLLRLARTLASDVVALQRRLRQCYSLGDYSEAQKLAQELKTETETQYGNDHPVHFSALSNLALIYKTIGKYQEAQRMYKDAYEGYKSVLGADHKSSITVLHNLGLTYKASGEPDTAARILEEVLTAKQQNSAATDLPATQVALASCYRDLDRTQEAEDLLTAAIQTLEKLHGDCHLALCPALNALGLLYKHTKSYQKAQDLLIRALEMRVELSSEDHPETLAIRHNLAELYLVWGKTEEAQNLLRENVTLMEKKTKQ